MNQHKALYPVLEMPTEGFDLRNTGYALARIVEAHPALEGLMDFYSPDPVQMALEVGMVSIGEEDGIDDLAEIDFGPAEWFEPAVGLAAVREALRVLRADPRSIAAALYEPDIQPQDVIADLEVIEAALLIAQQQEIRFHLAIGD
jgi:hypothetical protein